MPFLLPNQQRQSTEGKSDPVHDSISQADSPGAAPGRVGSDSVIYTYMNIIFITTELYLP